MKPTADHPSIDALIAMLGGEASSEQSESLIRHFETCERCAVRVERIWSEVSPFGERSPKSMDEVLSSAMEARLFQRIQRIDLVENATTFGTQGFLYVTLGLVRPLIHVLVAMAPRSARRR